MSKLLERIDQKLSFILSSLVGKQKIKTEDIEDLEVDRELLIEQFENERAILNHEVIKFEEKIDEQMMINLAGKVYVYYDTYASNDEEQIKELKEDLIFDDLDIENLMRNKNNMVEFIFENFEDVNKNILTKSIEEILNV